MRRLVFADLALDDLRDIAHFTEARWGADQKRRYLSSIKITVQRLRENPRLGRNRQDVHPGYYSLLAGRHVIFYRFTDDECEIVRIIHDRMDVHRLLGA
ncbi:MAG TPA: type II toxin-antitoxin system RelE/ParE family toxin [Dongiaceae bacterium]|nr:type II toxin-antitoxin system RelE/ParE family toxin [Dongiaceae bacterium]